VQDESAAAGGRAHGTRGVQRGSADAAWIEKQVRHTPPLLQLALLAPVAECLPDEQEADREAAVAAAGEQRLSELLLSSLVSSPPEREPLPRNLLQTVRIPLPVAGLPLLGPRLKASPIGPVLRRGGWWAGARSERGRAGGVAIEAPQHAAAARLGEEAQGAATQGDNRPPCTHRHRVAERQRLS